MSDHDGAPAGRDDADRGGTGREGVASRLAHQWAAMRRQEREPEPVEIAAGTSNFSRAEVPYGVDLAAAWSWRLLVIAAAAALLGYLISFLAVIVIPVVVALLISALVVPIVDWLERIGVRRSVGRDPGRGLSPSARWPRCSPSPASRWPTAPTTWPTRPSSGLQKIKDWLRDGPLHASDSQINDYIKSIQDAISEQTGEGGVITRVTEVGTAVGHILAGFFIVLFSTYFFLSDGNRIWAWVVRLSPRPPASGSTARAGSRGSR